MSDRMPMSPSAIALKYTHTNGTQVFSSTSTDDKMTETKRCKMS